jgi:hypothetical protein
MARFTFGDSVRVNRELAHVRAGQAAEVVAVTPIQGERQAVHYRVAIGSTVYQVDVADGGAAEFPETSLEAIH